MPRAPPPASSRGPGAPRRPRPRRPPRPPRRPADAATPAAATFSLSSKMIRSASLLPMPGIDDEHRLVLLAMIASCRSAVGREPTIASATFGPDAGHGEQQVEEPELLGRPEAVERLLVLADEVVRVQLQPRARLRRGEHRRRRVHPIADPADLDHERVERDRRRPCPRRDAITQVRYTRSATRSRSRRRSRARASRTARS